MTNKLYTALLILLISGILTACGGGESESEGVDVSVPQRPQSSIRNDCLKSSYNFIRSGSFVKDVVTLTNTCKDVTLIGGICVNDTTPDLKWDISGPTGLRDAAWKFQCNYLVSSLINYKDIPLSSISATYEFYLAPGAVTDITLLSTLPGPDGFGHPKIEKWRSSPIGLIAFDRKSDCTVKWNAATGSWDVGDSTSKCLY